MVKIIEKFFHLKPSSGVLQVALSMLPVEIIGAIFSYWLRSMIWTSADHLSNFIDGFESNESIYYIIGSAANPLWRELLAVDSTAEFVSIKDACRMKSCKELLDYLYSKGVLTGKWPYLEEVVKYGRFDVLREIAKLGRDAHRAVCAEMIQQGYVKEWFCYVAHDNSPGVVIFKEKCLPSTIEQVLNTLYQMLMLGYHVQIIFDFDKLSANCIEVAIMLQHHPHFVNHVFVENPQQINNSLLTQSDPLADRLFLMINQTYQLISDRYPSLVVAAARNGHHLAIQHLGSYPISMVPLFSENLAIGAIDGGHVELLQYANHHVDVGRILLKHPNSNVKSYVFAEKRKIINKKNAKEFIVAAARVNNIEAIDLFYRLGYKIPPGIAFIPKRLTVNALQWYINHKFQIPFTTSQNPTVYGGQSNQISFDEQTVSILLKHNIKPNITLTRNNDISIDFLFLLIESKYRIDTDSLINECRIKDPRIIAFLERLNDCVY